MNKTSSIKRYYIYERLIRNKSIHGILIKINFQDNLIQYIKPHEKACPIKTKKYSEEFSSGKMQNSPIILGTIDQEFERNLSKSYHDSLLISETKQDRIWQTTHDNYQKIIFNITRQLIILDGHHRFEAFRRLKKDFFAWIIPFNKINILSFTKIFFCGLPLEFLSLFNNKFTLNRCNELTIENNRKQIKLFFKNKYYQLGIQDNDDFIHVMLQLDEILSNLNCSLIKIKKYNTKHIHNVISASNNEHIIITYSSFSHVDILKSLEKGHLLPIHITCFHPKPIVNRYSVLET